MHCFSFGVHYPQSAGQPVTMKWPICVEMTLNTKQTNSQNSRMKSWQEWFIRLFIRCMDRSKIMTKIVWRRHDVLSWWLLLWLTSYTRSGSVVTRLYWWRTARSTYLHSAQCEYSFSTDDVLLAVLTYTQRNVSIHSLPIHYCIQWSMPSYNRTYQSIPGCHS